jgi:hypothetical protein
MPVPVAFPLASFLARAGITALGTGAATEGIKSLQNQGVVNPNMAQQALMRTIMGPTSEIFNRTTDTPSGKVFAPTGEVIEPNQIPGIAPPEQQQGITGLPIPEQQQGITGLPIPEKAPGLPGLINPEQVDTSILNKEETTENVSTQDLTVENIQNKIKYKKSKFDKNITEAYLGDKKIAEIEKDTDSKKTGNQFDYTINWTNEKGEIDYDDYDRETGFNSAKYTTALGLINTIKSQEKEYLNKFIKAVENKDYDTLNKIREEERGYDFEDSEFRSKEFKDTLIKYIPKQVDLYRNNAILEQEAIKETLNRTSNPSGSLTEVSTNPSEPFDNTDTSAVDFFPFNPIDFKKNGILNNPEIVKAFDDLKNDVKIKPPVGFNEDYMALQQSDSFYLTPPRAQMEITLKYLEKQLEENKASEETLNLIKNLNKDLQAKIKDTGYYAENKKVEDRITNLPGMTNKLKKLKSSN